MAKIPNEVLKNAVAMFVSSVASARVATDMADDARAQAMTHQERADAYRERAAQFKDFLDQNDPDWKRTLLTLDQRRAVFPNEPILKAEDWQRRLGIRVNDPDGWRTGFTINGVSLDPIPWDAEIDREEFEARCSVSTVQQLAEGTADYEYPEGDEISLRGL